MSRRIRSVVVASDDRLFADSVAEWIRSTLDADVHTAGDGVLALALVRRLQPEVVLLLTQLSRLDTAALSQQVARRWPGIGIVALGVDAPQASVRLPEIASAESVLEALQRPSGTRRDELDHRIRPDIALQTLTRRERSIFRLIAEGYSMRDISQHLGISRHTVRTHAQNLYAKLGCHSRVEVLGLAADLGLIDRGSSRSAE